MPGRSRTGSRPLSTVMSLASYATRCAPLWGVRRLSGGGGRGCTGSERAPGAGGSGAKPQVRALIRPCSQRTSRGPRTAVSGAIRAISRRSAVGAAARGSGADADTHLADHTRPDRGRRAFDDRGLEVAQLAGPDRPVGDDHGRDAVADRVEASRAPRRRAPTISVQRVVQHVERGGLGEAELGPHALERVADRDEGVLVGRRRRSGTPAPRAARSACRRRDPRALPAARTTPASTCSTCSASTRRPAPSLPW